jgi:hypothetical protein
VVFFNKKNFRQTKNAPELPESNAQKCFSLSDGGKTPENIANSREHNMAQQDNEEDYNAFVGSWFVNAVS